MGGARKVVGGKSAGTKALQRLRKANAKGGLRIVKDDLTPFVAQEANPNTSKMIWCGQMAIEDAGDFHMTQSAGYIVSAKAVFRSTLLKSGVRQAQPGKVTTSYRAAHGIFVEEGTRPHMPPVEKLKPWAKKKLGDEKKAWAVAMKIKKKGTKPVGFFRKGWVGVSKFMNDRFQYWVKKEMG